MPLCALCACSVLCYDMSTRLCKTTLPHVGTERERQKKEGYILEKRYLVTGYWTDKNTGKPVSGIAEISEGINKNGQHYAIANTDSRETPTEGAYPVGTILLASVTLAQESPSKATLNLKGNTQ